MSSDVRQRWVRRWDAQQERYIADREERFRVVADVLAWSLRRSSGPGRSDGSGRRPRVVDLGCGPGSLSTRLVAELPDVEIVGVDADPLLLGLGAESGLRTVRADLTDPEWPAATGLAQPWDAAVSSTALHWLQPDALRELYRTVAARLRPGGVFVDADHRTHTDPVASELARHVRDARAERAGVTGNEEWGAWWEAVLADPELGPLVDARSATAIAHSGGSKLTLEQQRVALREAGFSTVTTVWQCGDDFVLVAVR
jgi:SAM-dependent methyltransferase